MNDIKLLGRMTKNADVKLDRNGRNYTRFTLAVPRKTSRKDTDFITCIAFDKLATDIAAFCKKSQRMVAEGRLQVTSSLDEDTKRVRYQSIIILHSAEFLDNSTGAVTLAA